MESQILEVKNLKKSYRYPVLNNINFTIDKHDVYALVGINGSGKTTLLSILAGMLQSDGGTIHLNEKAKEKNTISISFQPTSLYPYLTGKDNIELLSPNPERAFKLLNQLNQSENILTKKVKKLSFGQRQRLGLSIALSKEASLYLLDEPTNGLDVTSYRNLVGIIKEMSKEGSAFIVASHEWGIIGECANRLGMIYNGEIRKELNVMQHLSEDSKPTIQIKTLTPLKIEDMDGIIEVREYNQLDSYTWRMTLSSQQAFSAFQKSLVMKNIPVQELIHINPVQEWESLYQQWVEEGDVHGRVV